MFTGVKKRGKGVPPCLNQLSQLLGRMGTVYFMVQYSLQNSVQCTVQFSVQ